ncbi:MAG: hypothetical protein Q9164_002992 [Protoblastenia rupestris]
MASNSEESRLPPGEKVGEAHMENVKPMDIRDTMRKMVCVPTAMGRNMITNRRLIIIGMIISSTAETMDIFIARMAIAGAGAGTNELTALAVTSELAPTRQRGKYVAVLVFAIVPFCPSVLWDQFIAASTSWRNCGTLCGAWAAVGLVMTVIFYFPSPRTKLQGLTKMEVFQHIDFVGGLLSISGMLVFMMGLQRGGYQPRDSAHVLAPLLIGFFLLIAFVLWEWEFAEFPMFPARLEQSLRILTLALIITSISGANFSVLLFWPTQAFNVYGHHPIGVGIRVLPIGFAILVGAFVVLWLLSVFKVYIRELMIASSVIMTAGVASLACLRADNLHKAWGLLVLAGLGIGGIVIPASIITTITCPDYLIATVAALTLAIRVIGGSIGYTVYYNVFHQKFLPNAIHFIGGAMTRQFNVISPLAIQTAIKLTGAWLLEKLHNIPGIGMNETWYAIMVEAGKMVYAESYRWVYLTSIAFGGTSVLASVFLGDIGQYMDDHVAVVM